MLYFKISLMFNYSYMHIYVIYNIFYTEIVTRLCPIWNNTAKYTVQENVLFRILQYILIPSASQLSLTYIIHAKYHFTSIINIITKMTRLFCFIGEDIAPLNMYLYLFVCNQYIAFHLYISTLAKQ